MPAAHRSRTSSSLCRGPASAAQQCHVSCLTGNFVAPAHQRRQHHGKTLSRAQHQQCSAPAALPLSAHKSREHPCELQLQWAGAEHSRSSAQGAPASSCRQTGSEGDFGSRICWGQTGWGRCPEAALQALCCLHNAPGSSALAYSPQRTSCCSVSKACTVQIADQSIAAAHPQTITELQPGQCLGAELCNTPPGGCALGWLQTEMCTWGKAVPGRMPSRVQASGSVS